MMPNEKNPVIFGKQVLWSISVQWKDTVCAKHHCISAGLWTQWKKEKEKHSLLSNI